jgi:hypothetical protein
MFIVLDVLAAVYLDFPWCGRLCLPGGSDENVQASRLHHGVGKKKRNAGQKTPRAASSGG